MTIDTQEGLLIGALDLINGPADAPFSLHTEADNASWGNPVAVTRLIKGLLQDGAGREIESFDNREGAFLRVQIRADDPTGLGLGEAALFAELYRRNTLTWTPPYGGPSTMFELAWSELDHEFKDTDENLLQRTYGVRLEPLPFGGSVDEVVSEATGDGEAVTTVNIDTASSTTGWTGSVGASALTPTSSGGVVFVKPPTRTNMVRNPSAEVNAASWTPSTSGATITRTNFDVVGPRANKQSPYWFRVYKNGSTPLHMVATDIAHPVTPGLTYRLSAWMSRSQPVWGELRIYWYNASGGLISTTASSEVSPAFASWTRYSVSGVAPAGAVNGRPVFTFNTTTTEGGELLVDAILFEQSSTLDPYFDGSTPDGGGFGYKWLGTAHASPSVRTPIGLLSLRRSSLSQNFSTTPHLLVDFGTDPGLASSVTARVVNGSGTHELERLWVAPQGDRWRAAFACNHTGVTAIETSVGSASTGAPTILEIDNLARSSSAAQVVGTARQLSRVIEVGGSARTQGSLAVEHPTSALGSTLVYTMPGESPYSPPLRPYRTSGGTVTGDAALISGAREPIADGAGFLARIPVSAVPEGGYHLYARVRAAATATIPVEWRAQTRIGSQYVGPIHSGIRAIPFVNGVWQTVFLGATILLPGRVPRESTAVLDLSIARQGAGTVPDLDEAWLFNVTAGSLTWVELGSSAPAPLHSNRLWIESPTIDDPLPQVWRGNAPDRSDAYAADPGSWGKHIFPGGQVVTVFTVTSNAVNPGVSMRHRPRWHTHAAS